MLIVDAQIHLWGKGKPSAHHRQTPYLKDEALAAMDEAGVTRAIIHPPMWDPDSNEVAVEAAAAHPDRFAILGFFPLNQPDKRGVIDSWMQRPGMLGARFYFNQPHDRSWPTDGTIDWLWPAAERVGMPLSLAAANFLPVLDRVAQAHPKLKLIVDHMAVPPASKGPDSWRMLPELLKLARHPNIAVKATGQAGYCDDAYPFRMVHDKLHAIYDAFGPQRMFWGTDITRMHCTWRQCVTLFTEELPWLKGKDLELVMGRAVCDWIGWKV